MQDRQYPLYHEELEHENCGVGAVADLNGRATHRTVDQALSIVSAWPTGPETTRWEPPAMGSGF